MRLIKLDAIGSTNDFLKKLSADKNLENFTVVTAESQTNGKGQMGAKWNSEPSKNLIMSVLIQNAVSPASIFNLNIAIAVSAIDALQSFEIPDLSIKWPNDILSGNKKIGGVLIENSIKTDRQVISIVGIGININQSDFENLPNASSLKLICNSEFDKDAILFSIMKNIQANIELLTESINSLQSAYIEKLFKKGIPTPFLNQHRKQFMGIIQGVSKDGKLQVLLEDETLSEYDIKEIKMLY